MTHRYLDRVYLREPVPAGSYLAALPSVRALGDREHPLKIPADVTFLGERNGQVHPAGGGGGCLRL